MQGKRTDSYFPKRFPCLRFVLEIVVLFNNLMEKLFGFFRTFYFISIMSDYAPKRYLKLEKRAFFFSVLFYDSLSQKKKLFMLM